MTCFSDEDMSKFENGRERRLTRIEQERSDPRSNGYQRREPSLSWGVRITRTAPNRSLSNGTANVPLL